MVEKKSDGRFDIWPLAIKTIVILVIVGVFLDFVLPDFSRMKMEVNTGLTRFKAQVDKNLKDERTKLYVLSFVQNPAALQKTSEIAEREGKIESAIRDMELAIGLLEMNNADKAVIKRYYDRVAKLKADPRFKPAAAPEVKPAK